MTCFAPADGSPIRDADLGRLTLERLMKMLAALDGSLWSALHVEVRNDVETAMTSLGRGAGNLSQVESGAIYD